MENQYRSIYCGNVNEKYVGKEIKLAGWINSIRNLGSLVFITLRDETGIVQLISSEPEKYSKLNNESTITVKGIVKERTDNMINNNMKTGKIEVEIKELTVLGECKNILPFEVNTSRNANEETRLKYRYIDLRNKQNHDNIILRTNVISYIREIMNSLDFTEIQTPIITASSPEGARDFVVPSRKFKGKFYALPQAPQIFKELLMCSGFNKYFQIAPCFRDEDPRSDRLYGEFYQLDFEMSFAGEEDIYEVGEKVFYDVFTKFSDKYVSPRPFRRISYKESMLKYGSDKPDLRNPLIIEDLTDILTNSDFAPFKNNNIRGIKVEKCDKSNSWYKAVEEFLKENGASGLCYIKIEENNFKSSIDKYLTDEERKNLKEKLNLENGNVLFIVADKKNVSKVAGILRTKLGEELELIDKNRFEFCIVNDFPMYEYNEETKGFDFTHNPFSMPQGGMDSLQNKNPGDILAYQYDFVCNGLEMASGGERNYNTQMLKKAFEIAGYEEKDIEEKFTSLYNAFQYGAPPHAGMAPGIDRMLMLLLDETNIREVVAFPISASGQDFLMGCPTEITEKQLREVHIKVRD